MKLSKKEKEHKKLLESVNYVHMAELLLDVADKFDDWIAKECTECQEFPVVYSLPPNIIDFILREFAALLVINPDVAKKYGEYLKTQELLNTSEKELIASGSPPETIQKITDAAMKTAEKQIKESLENGNE